MTAVTAINLNRAKSMEDPLVTFDVVLRQGFRANNPPLETYRQAARKAVEIFTNDMGIDPENALQAMLCHLRHYADLYLIDQDEFAKCVVQSAHAMQTLKSTGGYDGTPLTHFLIGLRIWDNECENNTALDHFDSIDWKGEIDYRLECEEEDRDTPRRRVVVCDTGATRRIANYLRSNTLGTWESGNVRVDKEERYTKQVGGELTRNTGQSPSWLRQPLRTVSRSSRLTPKKPSYRPTVRRPLRSSRPTRLTIKQMAFRVCP
jgi:hypothetical protein